MRKISAMARPWAVLLFWLVGCSAHATVIPPDVLEDTKPFDSRGNLMPVDTVVFDHQGQSRPISAWMEADKPVVLTFNYMGCAML